VEDARPDPEALLASIRREEARRKCGKLKIFFGMAPGVGKTYAMLREARSEEARNIDVVVGLVETHGRAETAAMLEGLVTAPRRRVEYRGTVLEEMDLDAIIFLRPKLVLVDELAHTNAPGSRHPKRYQDVFELLDLGINIFTTLNVQHVESRADTVRQLTGVTVQETVPDSVLERADEVTLVDLSPASLRERLREGKVYLGNRAATASENFFKEENLVALREIALRLTAERVDQQLRTLRRGSRSHAPPGSSGRLMVAVGPSPYSLELVRRTRRIAYTLDASWLVVSIESGQRPSVGNQRQLDKNLALARELGAEVVFTRDDDIARALLRVAKENHVTQLIVGKPMGSAWRERWSGGSLLDRLMRDGGTLDIQVIAPVAPSPVRHAPQSAESVSWSDYGSAIGGILGATALNYALAAFIGYWSLALVYLLAILLLGLRLRRGPLLLAAALSAVLWDFLFIPPLYTFYIARFDDAFMLGLFFVVALVTGQLTSRLRSDERNERRREQKASALYRLARSISLARSTDEVLWQAVHQIRETFELECAFYIARSTFGLPLSPHPSSAMSLEEKEHGVAVWSYRNRRTAGRFTDTLASSQAFYLPLLTAARAYGVLALKPAPDRRLNLDERDLLESFAQQIAMVLEKESLRTEAETGRVAAQSEELYRSLFNSVSHELQTPLAVIQSGLDELNRTADVKLAPVAETMTDAMERLKRLVKNLLDSARLETGRLEPKREWGEVRDLIDQATDLVDAPHFEKHLLVDLRDDLPLIHIDFGLASQAIANVLHNAVIHSPASVKIRVEAETSPAFLLLRISDNGPGIPPDLLETIFDRFARGRDAKPGGSGLGLAIAKGFIQIQGGTIEVLGTPGGGATFLIRLPLEKPPDSLTLDG
jgi:two-component system, OmpR family, sensor histidine kinase KdpD